MPKIRDLGINTIPATMQPPEIGDGGGGGDDCNHPSHRPPPCPNRSRRDDDEEPCDEPTLHDPSWDCDDEKKASGLPQDAIAQLKQQLQQHLSGERQF